MVESSLLHCYEYHSISSSNTTTNTSSLRSSSSFSVSFILFSVSFMFPVTGSFCVWFLTLFPTLPVTVTNEKTDDTTHMNNFAMRATWCFVCELQKCRDTHDNFQRFERIQHNKSKILGNNHKKKKKGIKAKWLMRCGSSSDIAYWQIFVSSQRWIAEETIVREQLQWCDIFFSSTPSLMF